MLKQLIKNSFSFDTDKLSFVYFEDGTRYDLMFHHVLYDGNTASFCYTSETLFHDGFRIVTGANKEALAIDFLMALEKATGHLISVSCADEVSFVFSSRMADVTFVICV